MILAQFNLGTLNYDTNTKCLLVGLHVVYMHHLKSTGPKKRTTQIGGVELAVNTAATKAST